MYSDDISKTSYFLEILTALLGILFLAAKDHLHNNNIYDPYFQLSLI